MGRKTIVLTFQMTNKRNLTPENLKIPKKGNIKREIESLLIVAKNNAIRTKYVKAKIDKSEQNSRYRLSGNRDKKINHIIGERSKLAQKEYKSTHN